MADGWGGLPHTLLQRHATRIAKQVLYGMLDLIEAAPQNAAAHAAKMRRRMEELEASERDESAKIRGAKIVAAAVPPVPTGAEVA